jgi:Fe-S-cluster-containing hydrogenase component 2
MKRKRLFAALALLCLLLISAYAVAQQMSAVVDDEKCNGCGSCVQRCPEGAIALNGSGFATVDKEKCTGCGKCVKACPFEALTYKKTKG